MIQKSTNNCRPSTQSNRNRRFQPDIAANILQEAPKLVNVFLDGLIWRSHKTKDIRKLTVCVCVFFFRGKHRASACALACTRRWHVLIFGLMLLMILGRASRPFGDWWVVGEPQCFVMLSTTFYDKNRARCLDFGWCWSLHAPCAGEQKCYVL